MTVESSDQSLSYPHRAPTSCETKIHIHATSCSNSTQDIACLQHTLLTNLGRFQQQDKWSACCELYTSFHSEIGLHLKSETHTTTHTPCWLQMPSSVIHTPNSSHYLNHDFPKLQNRRDKEPMSLSGIITQTGDNYYNPNCNTRVQTKAMCAVLILKASIIS